MSRAREEWRLEAHVCRVCFGRIASREADDDGKRLYRCANCGLEAEGHKPSALCACGAKLRKGKNQWVDAGLRCHPNQQKSPEFPAEIVASFNGVQV